MNHKLHLAIIWGLPIFSAIMLLGGCGLFTPSNVTAEQASAYHRAVQDTTTAIGTAFPPAAIWAGLGGVIANSVYNVFHHVQTTAVDGRVTALEDKVASVTTTSVSKTP